MFYFEDPSDLDTDWYLGDRRKSSEHIPKELLQKMSNFHLIGIQFLHENFVRKRRGVILNEDEDMNMTLQVCTFLRAVRDRITTETPVIIICPENSLCTWHYHFSEVGFDPKIVSAEIFDVSEIYLLSFESVRLFEKLKHLNFFCAVIDDFDIIATKVIVRKVNGIYRIGLTKRNFYKNPDQKLRWTMLNWACPGCVGKLKEFYHIDHRHSLAFADNYRFWWMRLTFKYCASFEKPNDNELQEYQENLLQWGSKYGILTNFNTKKSKPKRKTKANGQPPKARVQNLKPPGVFRMKRSSSRKFSNPRESLSSSEEDNGPGMKKLKSIKTTKETFQNQNERATTSTHEPIHPLNLEEFEDMVDHPKLEPQEDTGKLGEDTDSKPAPEPITNEDSKTVEEKTSDSSDFSNFFSSTSNKKKPISDDEDPILSFIMSREPDIEIKRRNSESDVKINQSSDTDSDIFSDLVKNKDTAKRFHATQQISQVLDNLSDEDVKCGTVSDDDFFSDLILGKIDK